MGGLGLGLKNAVFAAVTVSASTKEDVASISVSFQKTFWKIWSHVKGHPQIPIPNRKNHCRSTYRFRDIQHQKVAISGFSGLYQANQSENRKIFLEKVVLFFEVYFFLAQAI